MKRSLLLSFAIILIIASAVYSQSELKYYKASSIDPSISKMVELSVRDIGNNNILAGVDWSSPSASWNINTPYIISVRAEGDSKTGDKCGAFVLSRTIKESGDYLISTNIKNVGTDVFGGDGGGISLYLVKNDSQFLGALIYYGTIPISSKDNEQVLDLNKVVNLNSGDRIFYVFTTGIDGYGDNFLSKLDISKSDKKGTFIEDRGLNNFISNPPAIKKNGLKMKANFWVGAGAGIKGDFREKSFALWSKYIGDFSIAPCIEKPEDFSDYEYYNSKGVPVISQTWGASYLPYLSYNDALEYIWNGNSLGQSSISGNFSDPRISSHDLAYSHPKVYEAFGNYAKSSVLSGGGGMGFCDFTWGWMMYADQGFNPETIKAFREDLNVADKGISVSMSGGIKQIYKFKDYANYYFGGMPKPVDFGYNSWNEFYPVTEEEYNKAVDKKVFDTKFMLYDMLKSYEWLKLNDFFGKTTKELGGGFSSMPNPEWFRGGEDFLFGSSLENIFGIWEEFFNSPGYLDGAYNRYPYYRKSSNAANIGAVLEVGGGGNADPYYDNLMAYTIAYDLTSAIKADYLEADFWPNLSGSFNDMTNNYNFKERMKTILAYGLGFKNAKEDKLNRIPSDFITITSRRHIRVWSGDWNPWTWNLDYDRLTPEKQLYENGYSFEGISQEGTRLVNKEKLVIWAANRPVKKNIEDIFSKVKSGNIENLWVVAESMDEIIDENMKILPFSNVYPEFNLSKAEKSITGDLIAGNKNLGNVSMSGLLWSYDKGDTVLSINGIPIVKSLKMGNGNVYILLFSPNKKENLEMANLAYDYLLSKCNIDKNWYSEDKSVARIYYNNKMKVVGVQSKDARDTIYWQVNTSKPQGKLPYESTNNSSVKVKFKPNQTIEYIALPSGEVKKSVADKAGFVTLNLNKTNHQIFYCFDGSKNNIADISNLKKRALVLSNAMELK